MKSRLTYLALARSMSLRGDRCTLARSVVFLCSLALLTAACASFSKGGGIVPLVDHHQHLLSPAVADAWEAPDTVAFTHVTVVDVETGRLLADQTVVVAGNRIRGVGPAERVRPGTRVVDATGKFLIPGLWDMHTHVHSTGPASLLLYVANGVTGVRDMGADDFAAVRGWRDSIAAGLRIGPRMRIAAPVVENPGWIAAVRKMEESQGIPTEWLNHRFGPSTAAEAIAFVDSMAALGADHIKVRNYPAPAVLRALMQRARQRGLPVVAHTHSGMSAVEASAAGMASFEHGFFPPISGSRADRDAVYRQLAANGTAIVPTLVALQGRVLTGDSLRVLASGGDPRLRYILPRTRRRWLDEAKARRLETPVDYTTFYRNDVRNVGELVAAGVRVMVGSDAGAPLVVPGFTTHDELALLVETAGLTPLQALQAATLNPARFLGEGTAGTVASGRSADLVLLDANPLEDINNTRKIHGVVLNGRYFDRAALDALLLSAERATNAASAQQQTAAPAAASAAAPALTPEQRQLYAGSYTVSMPNGQKMVLHIHDRDGQLFGQAEGDEDESRLVNLGRQRLQLEETPDFILTFTVVNGKAAKFNVTLNGANVEGVRNPPAAP